MAGHHDQLFEVLRELGCLADMPVASDVQSEVQAFVEAGTTLFLELGEGRYALGMTNVADAVTASGQVLHMSIHLQITLEGVTGQIENVKVHACCPRHEVCRGHRCAVHAHAASWRSIHSLNDALGCQPLYHLATQVVEANGGPNPADGNMPADTPGSVFSMFSAATTAAPSHAWCSTPQAPQEPNPEPKHPPTPAAPPPTPQPPLQPTPQPTPKVSSARAYTRTPQDIPYNSRPVPPFPTKIPVPKVAAVPKAANLGPTVWSPVLGPSGVSPSVLTESRTFNAGGTKIGQKASGSIDANPNAGQGMSYAQQLRWAQNLVQQHVGLNAGQGTGTGGTAPAATQGTAVGQGNATLHNLNSKPAGKGATAGGDGPGDGGDSSSDDDNDRKKKSGKKSSKHKKSRKEEKKSKKGSEKKGQKKKKKKKGKKKKGRRDPSPGDSDSPSTGDSYFASSDSSDDSSSDEEEVPIAPKVLFFEKKLRQPIGVFGPELPHELIPVGSFDGPHTVTISEAYRLRSYSNQFPGSLSATFLNEFAGRYLGRQLSTFSDMRTLRLTPHLYRECDGWTVDQDSGEIGQWYSLITMFDLLLGSGGGKGSDRAINKALDQTVQRIKLVRHVMKDVKKEHRKAAWLSGRRTELIAYGGGGYAGGEGAAP